jgi:hypothetical protein
MAESNLENERTKVPPQKIADLRQTGNNDELIFHCPFDVNSSSRPLISGQPTKYPQQAVN